MVQALWCLRSGVPTVCALTRGSPSDWVPFAFPQNAHLLPHRCCFNALTHPRLPVTHTLNAQGRSHSLDDYFYYYAAGCSDTYVLAGRSLTARNRYDALVTLARMERRVSGAEALTHVRERFGFTSAGCGVNGSDLLRMLVAFDPCVTPVDERLLCAQRRRIGIDQMNFELIRLMKKLKLETLVLSYEAPWSATTRNLWKTEIMRSVPFAKDKFYTTGARNCTMRPYKNCMACEQGNLSKVACGGPSSSRPSDGVPLGTSRNNNESS
ncbi:hypothetical protein AB1Y20_016023 [Prymnesium parvum]|uniref:Uncharacterized protein n=1 Tax=Prymnesium parvum TaxID=97485 RepID=A0AB34K268_PRYPA